MTPACPSCGRRSRDGLLCQHCADRLRQDLAELPDLVRDLTVAFTRRSRFGTGGRGAETPVPFDDRPRAAADAIRNTLSTWIRVLDVGDVGDVGRSTTSWCAWLSARMERIRGHEAADQIVRDVSRCVRSARAAIDRPPDQLFVGACPTCGTAMYASPRETEVVCRSCRRAGVEELVRFDVAANRQRLRQMVEHQWGTVAQCALLLGTFGLDVQEDTIQNWARADRGGQLRRRGTDSAGHALYRVGDVADLAHRAVMRAATRRSRTESSSGA